MYGNNQSVKVVIDPGHGGQVDTGKSTHDGVVGPAGTLEKDINLALARRVQLKLGTSAVLTRSTDTNLSLAARQMMAKDAVVFVSLHANAGSSSASGAEIFVHEAAGGSSRALSEALGQQLASVGPFRGVFAEEMAVLSPDNLGAAAACLVEVDYLSNPQREALLKDPGHLDALSNAISGGVSGYVAQNMPAAARALGSEDDDDKRKRMMRDEDSIEFELIETNVQPDDSAEGLGYSESFDDKKKKDDSDLIVNLGKAAWTVLKDNKPTFDMKHAEASAVPKGVAFGDMSGWSEQPSYMTWRYRDNSKLGSWLGSRINANEVKMTLSWYYGGRHNGGRYIRGATLMASADTGWGQDVKVTVSFSDPNNIAKQGQPILASLPVRIRLEVDNMFDSISRAYDGILKGNGAGKVWAR